MRHTGGARSEEGPQEGDDNRNSPTAPSATRNTPVHTVRVLVNAHKVWPTASRLARPNERD